MSRIEQPTVSIEPKVAQPGVDVGDFWEKNVRRAPLHVAHIVGMDWASWVDKHDLKGIVTWVRTLRQLMSSTPQRSGLTTIFIMAWPHEVAPRGVGDFSERFEPLIRAGAKIRHKVREFYGPSKGNFEDSFVRDLQAHGMLTPPPPPKARAYRPSVSTEADADNQRMRHAFYANPPFRWKPEEIRELFGLNEPTKD